MKEKFKTKSYRTWICQRSRCNNPNNTSYRYYGGRGIKVKYSSEDFVEWWDKEILKFNGENPSVGRIDHSGHYEFGNIKMQELKENLCDGLSRGQEASVKSNSREVILINFKNNNPICIFKSVLQAESYTGVLHSNIASICRNRYNKTKFGYTFKYYNDWLKLEHGNKSS